MQAMPLERVTEQAGLEIERDAARDGVPRRFAWTAFWFQPTGLIALLAAGVIFRPAYDRLLQEDYPVEWAQFSFCLFTSIFAVLSGYFFARRGQWAIAITLFLLGLGTFLLAGEEISWGQRVLGITTPAELDTVNAQAELNLHNVTAGFDVEMVFRQVSFAIGIIGTAVPLLARLRSPILKGVFWRTLSPPLFTVPLFAMMIGYRVFRVFEAGEIAFAVRLQEWIEFCQYLGLVVTITVVYLNLRATDRPEGIAGPPGRHALRDVAERDYRTLTTTAVAITALTCAFAVMSAVSGIRAGNA
jgi:hypothetical protein